MRVHIRQGMVLPITVQGLVVPMVEPVVCPCQNQHTGLS